MPTGIYKRTPKPISERFWAKVARGNDSACWEWQGGTVPGGYGSLTKEGKARLAHRISWEIHHGPIPDGLLVCHTCDNPPCVNPDHLFLGTASENTRDMWKKGRHSRPVPRATHCKRGHEYNETNTYRWAGNGARQCRACHREHARHHRMTSKPQS